MKMEFIISKQIPAAKSGIFPDSGIHIYNVSDSLRHVRNALRKAPEKSQPDLFESMLYYVQKKPNARTGNPVRALVHYVCGGLV